MSNTYSIRCSECGHFVNWLDHDSSRPFGSVTDLEEPESIFYCIRCSNELEEEAVKAESLPCNWQKARWEYRAAERLGYLMAGPSGASWSRWVKPDQIPPGWEERRPLSLDKEGE